MWKMLRVVWVIWFVLSVVSRVLLLISGLCSGLMICVFLGSRFRVFVFNRLVVVGVLGSSRIRILVVESVFFSFLVLCRYVMLLICFVCCV